MTRFYLLLAVSIISLGNGLHAEDIAYVSSKQTNIYKEASLNSDLMTVLEQNEQVLVLDQQGVWWQIKYTEVSGWLSRYSVSSARPPEEKNSIFGRLKNFFSSDSKRARVTLVSTAGSVRGLTEEQSDALGKTDFKAVATMEGFLVSEAEVDAFVTSAAE
ncbi:SH3 domain-containing protein [Gammaproteobacteria bacterium]|nr:SH3 domain-containing protein [Gammaproteobacteria bacterium]